MYQSTVTTELEIFNDFHLVKSQKKKFIQIANLILYNYVRNIIKKISISNKIRLSNVVITGLHVLIAI